MRGGGILVMGRSRCAGNVRLTNIILEMNSSLSLEFTGAFGFQILLAGWLPCSYQ